MKGKKPKEIREVLQQFIAKNHLEKGLSNQSIVDEFLGCCPEPLPKYIDKVEFRAKKLFVFLPTSSARQELHYIKDSIKDQLNEKLGRLEVDDIVLL